MQTQINFIEKEEIGRKQLSSNNGAIDQDKEYFISRIQYEQDIINNLEKEKSEEILKIENSDKKLSSLLKKYSQLYSIEIEMLSRNSIRITFPLFQNNFVELCIDEKGMFS